MSLVYFSPVPWASFSQRPHKFVEWYHSRSGEKVLWVDPYPTRIPCFGDFQRVKPVETLLDAQAPAWLTVLKPRALPIEPLPFSGSINQLFWKGTVDEILSFVALNRSHIGIGKPSELALQVLSGVGNVHSFYDAMDNFPAFYSGISQLSMYTREKKVAKCVSKILVSSSALKARFKKYLDKVVPVFNACSTESLPSVESLPYNSERLILGYVGTIGQWFDWPLVIALARQNPTACVRLIGPVFTPSPELLPDNIDLLPACSHTEAIHSMSYFSVGLIPFKRNELTASVDPIKYYEYRALGLPIMTTFFGQMSYRGDESGVFFMNKNSNLKEIVDKALKYEQNMAELKEFRECNGWESRFDDIGIFA